MFTADLVDTMGNKEPTPNTNALATKLKFIAINKARLNHNERYRRNQEIKNDPKTTPEQKNLKLQLWAEESMTEMGYLAEKTYLETISVMNSPVEEVKTGFFGGLTN